MNLIIAANSAETIEHLREGLAGCEEVSAVKLAPNQLFTIEGLDAFYTTVMGAERWGAVPIPHKAQVLKVAPEDRINGYPPYVIAGSVFNMEDSHDPAFQLRVIMKSVFTAIDHFNQKRAEVIVKIGFWSEDLCLPGLEPKNAGEIIKEQYNEHYENDN